MNPIGLPDEFHPPFWKSDGDAADDARRRRCASTSRPGSSLSVPARGAGAMVRCGEDRRRVPTWTPSSMPPPRPWMRLPCRGFSRFLQEKVELVHLINSNLDGPAEDTLHDSRWDMPHPACRSLIEAWHWRRSMLRDMAALDSLASIRAGLYVQDEVPP